MQFAIILALALLASAAAFAPVARVARGSSLMMADFSKEVGAQVRYILKPHLFEGNVTYCVCVHIV